MIITTMSHKAVSLILCLAVITPWALPNHVSAEEAHVFPDMTRSWFRYREAVETLHEQDVIAGYPDGTFGPRKTVNRAELLKIIFKARGGSEPVEGERCFNDVPGGAWFAPYVCAAKRRGIVQGYEDGTFKPEQPVNYAEAIKIVLLAYGKDITERPGKEWYEAYTAEMDKTEVLPRWSYLPWTELNRERAADMILRFVELEEDRIEPNLSAGCGKAARDVQTTLTVGGNERSFLLTVPTSHSPRDPSPLIVAFHGRTNSNEKVRSYYGLDREANDYFIAYPAAMQRDTGTFYWSNPGEKLSELQDIAFFDAMVKTIGENYCIDMNRIYTVGHSLGAWMANSVACARGGVVRASGTVGGDSVIAPCNGPSSAFIMHNPHDTLASFASTERARDLRTEQNACGTRNEETRPEAFKCTLYNECDGGNEVVWCPHEVDEDRHGAFYPHQWPDGTAEAIVDFFEDLK